MSQQPTVLQSGIPQIEQFFKVTSFCGDGRDVIQTISFPGTKQVLEVMGFPGSGGRSLSGLLTVDSPKKKLENRCTNSQF
jgi:hypothetical protein